MISADKLREYLIENPEDIIKILEQTDFYSISFFSGKSEIRCAYYEGGNPTSVCINCETLKGYVFSKGIGGDLFYIIAIHNNWSLNQTITYISHILGISKDNNFQIPYVFNGVYKKVRTEEKENLILPKECLNNFQFSPNLRFLRDNISLETQFKFNIRYDFKTNRIIVPWFDQNGNLVGITGRYNFNDIGNIPKWKALYKFSKGNFLYGMFENKEEIEKSDCVIIGESEKFVMQLDSFGYHNGLALGNCTITEKQARIIKSLPVNKIILALDEGVSVEHILMQCDKLKGGIFNNKEVWCIYNNDNSILKKGSKASPSDFGKENFEILLNKYCFKKEN